MAHPSAATLRSTCQSIEAALHLLASACEVKPEVIRWCSRSEAFRIPEQGLGLRLHDFALVRFDEAGSPSADCALIDRELHEVRSWLREQGAGGQAMTEEGFSRGLEQDAFDWLAVAYREAHTLLDAVEAVTPGTRRLEDELAPGESALRLAHRESASLRIGFGLSHPAYPGAGWCLSLEPAPPARELPGLDAGGEWRTSGGLHAVLALETVSSETCSDAMQAFLHQAIDAARRLFDRPPSEDEDLDWHELIGVDELGPGRVRSVLAGEKTVCLTHHEGTISALDNRCPHQGGPLGEGSIENGWLRCPWHGWDYHPCTGKPPGGYDDGIDTYPVKIDDDKIHVGMPKTPAHVSTVSDGMVQVMVDWGVRHVFGMVGHSNLGLADALRRRVEAGELHYIGIRHEGAAAFACSAYGKLTRKPAACLTIAGPGATNLLTGLWDAKVDRAPVLALTGQVATQYFGPGNFQEADLAAAFAPVATFSQTVLGPKNSNELMALALKHALTKSDVAHLIFPDEVQNLPALDPPPAAPRAGRMPEPSIQGSPEAMARAIDAIREAQRPVIIAGHGAWPHHEALIALAEKLDAPVITTFKAKGLIADDHPLGCGVLGRSGTPIASWFMNEADLLIVFGASFSNHTGITPKKPIIQVDYDPMAIAKFHPVDMPVWGEIEQVASAFSAAVSEPIQRGMAGEVAQRWSLWRTEKEKRARDDRGQGLAAAHVFAELSDAVPADAVIAVDVGNNTYSFGRYFESKGQHVLMSGYLGSIGFALPAALGAWAAMPDRKIVAVAGDGGLGQYLTEITTLVKYDMNVAVIVLNNGQLGKISKEQRDGEWPIWETRLVNPDFAAYAKLCGAGAERVSTREQLRPALQQAMQHRGPFLVEILQDVELL